MEDYTLTIKFYPVAAYRFLGGIVVGTILFATIYYFIYYLGISGHSSIVVFLNKFNMDKENNIPTYFSSLNLFVSAFILGLIAHANRIKEDKYWKQWAVLSLLFFFLSIDETASLHEPIGVGVSRVMHLPGSGHYGWGILGSAVMIPFLAFFAKFIFYLPSKTRIRFIISGAVFVTGAVGIEAIGGLLTITIGPESMFYYFSVVVEESMEMIGVLLFIKALLLYIKDNFQSTAALPEPLLMKAQLEKKNVTLKRDMAHI